MQKMEFPHTQQSFDYMIDFGNIGYLDLEMAHILVQCMTLAIYTVLRNGNMD